MSRRERILARRESAPLILPSMLLCDFGELRTEVRLLEAAGFEALHLDVMDGVFVPNFSYGMTVVEAFRKATRLPLDVHLMMVQPERYFRQFWEAGADSLTFHIEAVDDPTAAVEAIHALGMAAGVALDRDTPVEAIADVAGLVDIVLVMTIKAGFGGQKLMPDLLDKLAQVRELAGDRPVLEVDGGVNASSVRACVEAGAEWLVAGSAVFRGIHYETAHSELKELAGVC
jgi:ribulose-phosphate 3-epimerase